MRTPLLLLVIVSPIVLAMTLTGYAGSHRVPSLATPVADSAVGGCWHVVRRGESLRSIARHYYGSARLWRTVQVANDVGLRPHPGVRLWVPGHVMPELP